MEENVIAVNENLEPAAPVAISERIKSIDIVRGMALLGILVINIDFFALPSVTLFNPTYVGGFEGIDLLTWKFAYLFCFEKMMALFSMLFGGGLILMMDRFEKSGRKLGKFYFGRLFWLMLFGLLHAYLFWFGDILFSYAICGMIVYIFRKKSPRTLILVGSILILIAVMVMAAAGFSFSYMQGQAELAREATEAGETPTVMQQQMLDSWEMMQPMFNPSQETIDAEIGHYRGSWVDSFRQRAPMSLMLQTQSFLFMVLWRVSGLMLIGMALMKIGFFAGEKSNRTYVVMICIGYLIGLPAVYYGMSGAVDNNFDFVRYFMMDANFNSVFSILVALAHASLIILIFKLGLLKWLTDRLAAVGRMALSNYLFHTLVFTTLFYGYGFGLFGAINRFWLFCMVLCMWIFQLIISPIWLKKFRFGPAEWLWRSLTYRKKQPMRVSVENKG